LDGEQWINILNKIQTRPDLPLTLQGGEPTRHSDFYKIINGINPSTPIDLLTNGHFNAYIFMKNVKPNRFNREAKYASIRFSYHPEYVAAIELIDHVLIFQDAGYNVGIWMVDHPMYKESKKLMIGLCARKNIDFRLKEFLGWYNGKLYGTYKYEGACNGDASEKVMCKTTELIIGPNGYVYRCHSDLYNRRAPIGDLLFNFKIRDIYRQCIWYGHCNPCDVKLKTNRFQEFGHTSVDIVFDHGKNDISEVKR
jgi:hypothetical protein